MGFLNRLARDEWTLGVVNQTLVDIARHGITSPINWFANNSWRIFADPFCVVNADGSVTILAEVLNHWIGKGEIWIATVPAGHDPLKAIFRPHISSVAHLSYPSYIQHDSVNYAIMESFEAGALLLWRQSGEQWRLERTLLDRPAVDPTIYHDGNLWWLFCTFADDEPDERLHLFYAASIHHTWTPHPSNPIKTDRASARPAGALFKVDEMLLRPSQDSSKTYGGSLIFNQIVALTPETYQEISVRSVTPMHSYYCDGIHSIAAAGDYTLVDGKRWHRGPQNLGCLLTAKAFKMYRRSLLRLGKPTLRFVKRGM